MDSHRMIFKIGAFLSTLIISISSSAAPSSYNNRWVKEQQIEVEEIVIEAQKRAQSILDVPISVSLFEGDALEQNKIVDVFDLMTITPALRIGVNQNNSTTNFNIRGIGTSGSNQGLESSVGLYVNGIYRARQSAAINDFFDIEHIEVLRGPQGTLFGKNAASGAILFRSKRPTLQQEGYVEIGIGNVGARTTNAMYNNKISESTALRFSGFTSERDGLYDDLNLGKNTLNDRDRYGAEFQLLTEFNASWTGRLVADIAEIDENCCAAITLVDNLTQKYVSPSALGSDALIRTLGGNTTTSSEFSELNTVSNTLAISKSQDKGILYEATRSTPGNMFTSLTGYREYTTDEVTDGDFTDLDIFNLSTSTSLDAFSQEFRVLLEGDLGNLIIGTYYYRQRLDNNNLITLGAQANTFATADLDYQSMVQPLVDQIAAASTATGGLVSAPIQPFSDGGASLNLGKQKQESWAFFTQAELDISNTLKLIAGARYTNEKKEMLLRFTQNSGAPIDIGESITQLTNLATSGVVPPFDPTVFNAYSESNWGFYLPGFTLFAPRENIDERLTIEEVTGTGKLLWRVNENTSTYLSYSTGFKSGGINAQRIDPSFNSVFEPEHVSTFEVGYKTVAYDGRMKTLLTVHDTQVKDYQSNAFQGTGFNLQNAGELASHGAELTVQIKPVNDTQIDFSYAYSKVAFKKFNRANCWQAYTFHTGLDDPNRRNPSDAFCDRSGDRLSFNPEHAFNLQIQQDFALSNEIALSLSGGWNYVGDQIMDSNNDPLKAQESYSLFNANASLNLLPINLTIRVWGRNITDRRYYHTAFDVPFQTGKINAYPGAPRTFGIDARYSL